MSNIVKIKISLFCLLVIVLFVLIINIFNNNSIVILIALSFLPIIILSYLLVSKNVTIIELLFIVSILPLVVLDPTYHYNIMWLIVQDIGLIIIAITFLYKILFGNNNTAFIEKKYKILFYGFLFVIIFQIFVGIVSNHNIYWLSQESYVISYYLYFVPLFYYLKAGYIRLNILNYINGILIFIALEQIIISIIFWENRFVTFQAGILLLPASYYLTKILLIDPDGELKKSKEIAFYVILSFGIILTLTRALWISLILSFAVLLFSIFIHRKYVKVNYSIVKLVTGFGIVIFILIGIYNNNINGSSSNSGSNISTRAQSISEYSGDYSFLMRVELGYYVIKKIAENVLLGYGFGDSVNYLIMFDPSVKIYYPDNSILFILWKMGIIGLIPFIVLFYFGYKSSVYLIHKSDYQGKVLGISYHGFLSAMILFSIFAPNFVKYKYIIIIVLYLVIMEVKKNEANR